MKPIKWTQVLVAEGHENDFWVRVYHTEEDAPSFEQIRKAWTDENMAFPYIEICKPKPYQEGRITYQLTMDNYSEMLDTMEDAHTAMVSWLRENPSVLGINEKASLSESDSDDLVLDHIVLSYASWCEREGLPHQSMDELLHEDMTTEQRKQLTAFYLLWESLA
jgi:hypothetical protein